MPANHKIFQLPNDSQEEIAQAQVTKPKAVELEMVPRPHTRLNREIISARAGETSRAQLQEQLADYRHLQRRQEQEEANQIEHERKIELRRWRANATQQDKQGRAVGIPARELAIPVKGYGETLSELGSADNAKALLEELRNEDHEARAVRKGFTSHSLPHHERAVGSLRKNGIYGVDIDSSGGRKRERSC